MNDLQYNQLDEMFIPPPPVLKRQNAMTREDVLDLFIFHQSNVLDSEQLTEKIEEYLELLRKGMEWSLDEIQEIILKTDKDELEEREDKEKILNYINLSCKRLQKIRDLMEYISEEKRELEEDFKEFFRYNIQPGLESYKRYYLDDSIRSIFRYQFDFRYNEIIRVNDIIQYINDFREF